MGQNAFSKIGSVIAFGLAAAGCNTQGVQLAPRPTITSSYEVANPISQPVSADLGFKKFEVKVEMQGIGVGGCDLSLGNKPTFASKSLTASAKALNEVFSNLTIVVNGRDKFGNITRDTLVQLRPIRSFTTINADTYFSSKFNTISDIVFKIAVTRDGRVLTEKEITGTYRSSQDIGADNVASSLFLGRLGGPKCKFWASWLEDSFSIAFQKALDETKKYLIKSRAIFEPKPEA